MKYIVMECHFSYAVVLDEEGHFIHVANMGYEYGQTITKIYPIQKPTQETIITPISQRKFFYPLVAFACCLLLFITTIFKPDQVYGSLILTINPQVRIDLDKQDRVVELIAMNEDGQQLIQSYLYKNKKIEIVMNELVDKAIDMNYLEDGDKIYLSFDGEDKQWLKSRENSLSQQLNNHLVDKVNVSVLIQEEDDLDYDNEDDFDEVEDDFDDEKDQWESDSKDEEKDLDDSKPDIDDEEDSNLNMEHEEEEEESIQEEDEIDESDLEIEENEDSDEENEEESD